MSKKTKATDVAVMGPDKFIDVLSKTSIEQVAAQLPNSAVMMEYVAASKNFAMKFDKEIEKDFPEMRKATIRNMLVFDLLTALRLKEEYATLTAQGYNVGFSLIGTEQELFDLKATAAVLGITLGTPNMLPAPNSKDPEQLQMDWKMEDVEVENEELKKELKEDSEKRKKIIEEQPEIDHTKILPTDEKYTEKMEKACRYYLDQPDGFMHGVIAVTDWMRDHLSYHKLLSDDVKENLDIAKNMTIGEVLEKVFEYTKPTAVVSGLGSAAYTTTKRTNSIIPTHCMFAKSAGALMSQKDIASIAKACIKAKSQLMIKAEDVKADSADDAVVKIILSTPSPEAIDKIMAQAEEDSASREIYARAYNTFIGKYVNNSTRKAAKGDNVAENNSSIDDERNARLRNIFGCILNLYADSSNRLSEFENMNPDEVLKLFVKPKENEEK